MDKNSTRINFISIPLKFSDKRSRHRMRDLCYDNEQLLWRSLRFLLPDGVDGTLLRTKMGFSSRYTPRSPRKNLKHRQLFLIAIRSLRDVALITAGHDNYEI